LKNIVLKTRFKGAILHGLYNEMIKNPPLGYKITIPSDMEKSPLTKVTFQVDNNLYKKFMYQFGAFPYFTTQLAGEKIDYENCDLIFAAQHLIKTERPWIVDLEFVNALAGYCNIHWVKNLISKKLRSNECKAILPWSNWGANTVLNSIDCTGFKDKIKVVRYTVSPKNIEKVPKKSGIRILFVGSINQCGRMREMYKGVYENVEAFIQLQDKYDDLELVIRSSITPEVRERVSKYPNIKIIDSPLSYPHMEELYRSADIFPHVGYEALNLSTLEAMSYGIPVIATNLYNIPEAITHMKNGMLIDLPDSTLLYTKNGCPNEYANPPINIMKRFRSSVIEKTKDCMRMLIEDSSLRQNIGREAAQSIRSGEFSMQQKNSMLKEIFDEATK
jgi:glycosyltransferase involved in cell wall biosynthesis